jgi:hypothetical protein
VVSWATIHFLNIFLTLALIGTESDMAEPQRDIQKEATGWIGLAVVMIAFPALFFLCVFFPIWVGLTPRW